ncbi:MAG: hypothetical protein JOZ89_08480 [Gammaproteobacteria bacterium]|nr:hypothetical protein [Gammaproteobacteria bacterium]
MSGPKLKSFLEQGHDGASVAVTDAQCVESGSTQNYSCLARYVVSGASDSSQDGSYQIGANATCDNSGNCQWQTDALGSASKQGNTADTPTESSSTPLSTPAGLSACDQNVSASSSAGCSFAENVFYEFYQQYGATSMPSGGTIRAYSPTAAQNYTLQCSYSDGQITCRNDAAPTSVVTFSESAVQNYTPAQAAKYAASANLGP